VRLEPFCGIIPSSFGGLPFLSNFAGHHDDCIDISILDDAFAREHGEQPAERREYRDPGISQVVEVADYECDGLLDLRKSLFDRLLRLSVIRHGDA
jgi:hypothetical protein